MNLRTQKVDSAGTKTYVTDGVTPASPVLKDGAAVYTPGISERRGSTSSFSHADALGSTRAITNSSQSVTDTMLTDMAQTTLSSYAIGYSPNLTVGSVTSSLPGHASLGGTTNYTHDAKLQLTQEQSTQGGGYTSVNAYDSAGNPTTFKGTGG